MIAFLGVGMAASGLTSIFTGRKPTIPEAEQFVRQQMEGQTKRQVDSVQMWKSLDGGYVGEAKVGSAVYDVTVEVNGPQMGLHAKIRRDAGALAPIPSPGGEVFVDRRDDPPKESHKDEKAVLRYKGKKGKFALWLVPAL